MNKFAVFYLNMSTFDKCILKVLEDENILLYCVNILIFSQLVLAVELYQNGGISKCISLHKCISVDPHFKFFIERGCILNF